MKEHLKAAQDLFESYQQSLLEVSSASDTETPPNSPHTRDSEPPSHQKPKLVNISLRRDHAHCGSSCDGTVWNEDTRTLMPCPGKEVTLRPGFDWTQFTNVCSYLPSEFDIVYKDSYANTREIKAKTNSNVRLKTIMDLVFAGMRQLGYTKRSQEIEVTKLEFDTTNLKLIPTLNFHGPIVHQ